jgi:hypothetical protein
MEGQRNMQKTGSRGPGFGLGPKGMICCCCVGKIRNPKHETRNKSEGREIQNSKQSAEKIRDHFRISNASLTGRRIAISISVVLIVQVVSELSNIRASEFVLNI